MSRWQRAVGIVGLLVVFWVGDRLYDVISSDGTSSSGTNGSGGGHQPPGGGEHQPPGGDPSSPPAAGDGDTSPSSEGGVHDPSQFDHG